MLQQVSSPDRARDGSELLARYARVAKPAMEYLAKGREFFSEVRKSGEASDGVPRKGERVL